MAQHRFTTKNLKDMGLVELPDGSYAKIGKKLTENLLNHPMVKKTRHTNEEYIKGVFELNNDGRIYMKIKPLSVNEAWQGRRFRSDKYKEYEKRLMSMLPELQLPNPPYELYYKFGFSSAASDWDNPCKPTTDILSKKYNFNDKLIKRAVIEVDKVKKSEEYFSFKITTLKQ